MKSNRRKLIAGILVATMALTGVLVGTVSADEGEGTANHREALMARVAEILGIDQQDLENAFEQSMQERMGEARDDRCQALIDGGIITQDQVDECREWMESRPDNRDEMQEWFEARPDMGEACPGFGSSRMGMGGRMPAGCGSGGRMPRGGGPGICEESCEGVVEGCPRA